MKRKKIIQVIPQLNSGGAEKFVVALCNELSKNNEVILVVLFPLNTSGFFTSDLYKCVKLISLNKTSGFSLFTLLKLNKVIKIQKPDVVHTHLLGFYYCLLSYFDFRITSLFFHTIHNDAVKENPSYIGYLLKKMVFKLRLVKPVTISDSGRESFNELYGIDAALVENGIAFSDKSVDYNSIEGLMSMFRITKFTKLFVNVASVKEQKNQIVLIDVFKRLIEMNYDVALILIGKKHNEEIFSYIQSNTGERVHYLGEKTHISDYMRGCDFFILSSLYEGMPISLIESFSVGCVPVCTPAGGVVNMIVDGENGILAKGFNEMELFDAVVRILSFNKLEVDEMRVKCIKSFERYSITKCAEGYTNLFKGDV